MNSTNKKGVLFINLGSPQQPTTSAVKSYLKEFLNDPMVIDFPAPLRWILINLFIIPRRVVNSAKGYEKVWTDKGSPLIINTTNFAKKVKNILTNEYETKLTMRYGVPSIYQGMDSLKEAGVNEIIAFPLYPHYAESSTGTAIKKLQEAAEEIWDTPPEIKIVRPFFGNEEYQKALSNFTNDFLSRVEWDHLLISYHGLPESHIKKTEGEAGYCLKQNFSCCEDINNKNNRCYKAHCYHTTKALTGDLQIPPEKFTMSFQSRVGQKAWIKPYTDETVVRLAHNGIKKLAVVSPAFVADCLETLEELGMRMKEQFLQSGGEEFHLVPCLNDNEAWVIAAEKIIRTI